MKNESQALTGPTQLLFGSGHKHGGEASSNRGRSPRVPGIRLPHFLCQSGCALSCPLSHCKGAHVLTEAGECPITATWEHALGRVTQATRMGTRPGQAAEWPRTAHTYYGNSSCSHFQRKSRPRRLHELSSLSKWRE